MSMVEMSPKMTVEDRRDLRALWIRVQDHACGVCGQGAMTRRYDDPKWLFSYNRVHDGQTCEKTQECFDCVLGVVCHDCSRHLTHFRYSRSNIPRQPVRGLSPHEWAQRAAEHMDLGVDVDEPDGRWSTGP